jgi:hypothetical protein
MHKIRMLLSMVVVLLATSPVHAADTSITYNSGLLVLLFVGFCALLIVSQLVPALLTLFGMTKEAAKRPASRNLVGTSSK